MFLELQRKISSIMGFLWFPALTVQVFFRRRTGFRELTPSAIITMTYVMLLYASLWALIGVPTRVFPLVAPARAVRVPPPPSIQPGYDAPFPPDWQSMGFVQQQSWVQQHRIRDPRLLQQQQEQMQREQQRLQKEAEEERESIAWWNNVRAKLALWPMYIYALAFLAWGLIQRRRRWKGILTGEMWHTYSRGMSWLMPVLWGRMREPNIRRIVDPLLCFMVSIFVYTFSAPLGLWLFFASGCFAVFESHVYELQLQAMLDQMDGFIEAEAMHDNTEWFKARGHTEQPPPSSEMTGGILPTGALEPELTTELERRKARREDIKARAAARAAEEEAARKRQEGEDDQPPPPPADEPEPPRDEPTL